MKAAPFAYARPSTVDGVLAALAASGGEGKILAGGQSLVPVLAMRLARPPVLVDINGVERLDQISLNDGVFHVGATARQRDVERDERTAAVPLLGLALPWVGHRELRSRGTVCGSLAHADPAAELPAVAVCLDAAVDIAGPSGPRTVPAREFFTGAMTTVLGADEVMTGASFPAAGPGEGFGFAEFARRHGDFALAGVAVRVRRSPRGAVLAAFGVSDRPVVRKVTDLLDTSGAADAGRIAEALAGPMAALAEEIVDTGGDAHASAGYRRRLFAVLAARELARAQVQALEEESGHRKPAANRRAGGPAGQRTRVFAPGERRCNGEQHQRGVAGGPGRPGPAQPRRG